MTERSQNTHEMPGHAGEADLLAGFAEAVPIPVVLLTSDTHIRYVNRAFVQMLGLDREHCPNEKLPNHWLVDPENALPRLRERLRDTAQDRACPEPMRLALRSANGREVLTQVHIRPLPNPSQGQDTLTVVTFAPLGQSEAPSLVEPSKQNNTCRMRLEQLNQKEEGCHVFFEYAPDGYSLYDLDGRFVDCNRAGEIMIGYRREELIGKSLPELNLLPDDQLPKASQSLIQGAVGKPTGPVEFTLIRKDGSTFPVEINTYPVRIQDQVLVLVIARDITEQKRAREAILDEKAFADSVINSLPGVFYMFDENGTYTWWNKHLEEITEYSSTEIPQIHPADLFAEPDRGRIKEAIARVFVEGTATIEADLVSKNGRKTPYFLTGQRVERDGKAYIIGLGIDITERRQAQQILERLNANLESSVSELERSNQELSDFAHITAHDLKAPLRGIATLAEWLDADYGENLGAEGRENLTLLRGRVERMSHLINGILRYSEIGHSDQPLELLDTQTLAEEVIEQITPPKHIEIRIEGTLPSVKAERTRLTQVFQNLISNAVKYIDKPQGHIRISACEDGDFWQFRVADNGPGIEAKHFARIFQMFQTLSPADHTNSTGLGLAVVKKIVDMYGGRIWIQSQLGQGSTFFFTMPKPAGATAIDD